MARGYGEWPQLSKISRLSGLDLAAEGQRQISTLSLSMTLTTSIRETMDDNLEYTGIAPTKGGFVQNCENLPLYCHNPFSFLNLSQASFRVLKTAPAIILCSVVAVGGSY